MPDTRATVPETAIVKAPCKINLNLAITGVRPDGYHELDTLFYPVGNPSDVLEFGPGARGSGLSFSCDDPALENSDNLVVKAYRRFAEASAFAPDISVRLLKNIPYGSGLGGASSDAAALLIRLNAQAGEKALSPESLTELAASLGADVAFFLRAVPARAAGIGEILIPEAVNLSGLTLCIACPNIRVSTAEAYRDYDRRMKKGAETANESLTRGIGKNTRCVCVTIAPLFNSFERVVFATRPELRRLKETLYAAGAAAAAMSGSGSAIFGLYRDYDKAFGASAALGKKHVRTYLSRL